MTQIRALERMLGGAGLGARRPVRLQRLAELYLEAAVLGDRVGSRQALAAAATACRRLLVAHPRYRRAAEVRLLLARVELRRGLSAEARRIVASLATHGASDTVRCEGWLVSGEAWRREGQHRGAAGDFRRAARWPRCPAEVAARATYQLGWSLIRAGDPRGGSRVLEGLLSTRLKPLLRQRVLSDLVLTWSTAGPPPGAARLLALRGGARGWALVERLAERLGRQGRLADLLALTEAALVEAPPAQVARRLLARRLEQVGRLGSVTDLDGELRRLSRQPLAARAGAAPSVARALVAAAERRRPRQRAVLRPLYTRVARDFGGTAAAVEAWRRLGDMALAGDRLERAARAYRKALAAAPSSRRAERGALGYRVIFCLQRQAARAGGPHALVVERLVAATRRFVREHPEHPQAAAVQVAASRALLRAGRWQPALAAARRALVGASGEIRAAARDTALAAAEALGRWQDVWELARLGAAVADEPGADFGPGAGDAKLAQRAAAAAMHQALRHARGKGDRAQGPELGKALRWAHRAAVTATTGELRRRARWLVASLAAGLGQVGRADRLYRQLAEDRDPRLRADRRRALIARAELAEATGRFAAALACYRAASELAPGVRRQLELVARAAGAAGHGRLRSAGLVLMRRARLLKASLPEASQRRWATRLGALLGVLEPKRALRYYLEAAREVASVRPRLAARLLLAAAELAPSRRRLGLALRAQQLAGGLGRAGHPAPLAAQAAVTVARARRDRLASIPARRRRAGLRRLVEALAPVVLAGHPRWSAAAASELAWVYGELGLAERRLALLASLAKLARREGGLSRATLAATGQRPAALRLARPAGPRAAYLAGVTRLLARGRHRAALRASSLALALAPAPRRAPLRCARAIAQAALGHPGRAWAELVTALEQDDAGSRCARASLRGLAAQRGAPAAATELIARLGASRPRVITRR